MEILTTLIPHLVTAGVPAYLSVSVTVVVVIGTMWLNKRKVDVEGATSLTKLQNETLHQWAKQQAELLEQNRELALDLHKLRESQARLHADMDALRRQNTRMYQHIVQLEALVQHYRPRCSECPHGPGEPPFDPPIPFKMEDDA